VTTKHERAGREVWSALDRCSPAILQALGPSGVIGVRYVVGFVHPFSVHVWLVVATDVERDGLPARDPFLEIGRGVVRRIGLPPGDASIDGSVCQSQETVDRDYKGSWFYVLRYAAARGSPSLRRTGRLIRTPTVNAMAGPRLVFVTGPIASGKSTVSRLLAERLRSTGDAVAVLDLDEVVETIGGYANVDRDGIGRAGDVLGELAAAWLDRGCTVVAHGSFFEDGGSVSVPTRVAPRRVRLLAEFDLASERVAGDPDRGGSKDLVFLRSAYDRYERLLPRQIAADWTFDTSTTPADQIADTIASALDESAADPAGLLLEGEGRGDFYCDEVFSGRTAVRYRYEGADVVAFDHTRPAYKDAHVVVVPRRHLDDLLAADRDELAELLRVVGVQARRVLVQFGACRVITNLGDYQDSKHLHFHVVSGDRT
jgi:histidine triad (HIT) family protein